MKQPLVGRRQLLRLSSVGLGVVALAACVNPSQSTTISAEPLPATPDLPTVTPEVAILPTATTVSALFDGMPHGITAEGFPYLGDPSAPVTMYDYSDFL